MVLGVSLVDSLVKLPPPTADFTNQIVIVTGANTGLGLETARYLVALGATKVILAVRDLAKGNEAKKSIIETTQRENCVEVWELDLCNYQSVIKFAARTQELPHINCLIQNASISKLDFVKAEEDDSVITINVVSLILLTFLLLPKLQSSASSEMPSHLVIVSSDTHNLGTLPTTNILNHFRDPSKIKMYNQYSVSKLMQVLLGRSLAESLYPSCPNVVVNVVDPGSSKTGILRNLYGAPWAVAYLLIAMTARTPEHAARGIVWAAAGGKETHGKYLAICTIKEYVPVKKVVQS